MEQFNDLLDDIKLISKMIRVIRDENNPDNRKYACGILEDLINRLYSDMEKKVNSLKSEK